ncbi:uncharacterized protein LOC131331503 [Rhododendron vialii]|uniref:uncharacterized protein LOC131331503 n=1 Tax=Rhododendron vialii TaxID=182163 RepID=UPI00265DB62F|nr:uncharacterized protein LOC131331503 [Rhododendron vialii]
MDEADFMRQTLYRGTALGFVLMFFQLLLFGLDDLALCSPAARKRMDFLTPVLGAHPFDTDQPIRWYIYSGFASLCAVIAWIPVKFSPARVEKFIAKALRQQCRTHVAFCICVWIHASNRLIAGGNWFFVGSLSCASIACVFAFMVVASSRDCLVLARWVVAHSTAVAVFLVFQGYFLQAVVSIFPVLPAVYAMFETRAGVEDGNFDTSRKLVVDNMVLREEEVNGTPEQTPVESHGMDNYDDEEDDDEEFEHPGEVAFAKRLLKFLTT